MVFYKEKAFLFKEYADRHPDRDLLSLFDEWIESKDFSDGDKAEIFKKFISIISNRIRRQILIPKLNIHLRHDPIALRDITRIILLAIKLGEDEERKEELQKNQ